MFNLLLSPDRFRPRNEDLYEEGLQSICMDLMDIFGGSSIESYLVTGSYKEIGRAMIQYLDSDNPD